MKSTFALLALLSAFAAQAVSVVTSTREKVSPANVVALKGLVDNNGLKINVLVEDKGGSTDLGNEQVVWLTMYLKGEIFSPSLSFKVADVYKFISATRVGAGLYKVKAKVVSDQGLVDRTFSVNASVAAVAIRNVKCEDGDFDCEAASRFSSAIAVE